MHSHFYIRKWTSNHVLPSVPHRISGRLILQNILLSAPIVTRCSPVHLGPVGLDKSPAASSCSQSGNGLIHAVGPKPCPSKFDACPANEMKKLSVVHIQMGSILSGWKLRYNTVCSSDQRSGNFCQRSRRHSTSDLDNYRVLTMFRFVTQVDLLCACVPHQHLGAVVGPGLQVSHLGDLLEEV